MSREHVTVHVKMDARTFRRFCLYDVFVLRRRWLSPAVFSAIFTAFATVCFCMKQLEQSALLGGVLLGVALVLPACYFLNFFLQMNDQVRRLGLKESRPVYSLVMGKKDVHITNDMKEEAEVVLPWKGVMGAWRVKGAIYLYANAKRAFILPDGQSDCSDEELWAFLSRHLPKEKLHGK